MHVFDDTTWRVESVVSNELGRIQSYIPGLPVVAFRFSEKYRQQNPNVQQKWVQTLLRAKGWIVPNYELAPNLQDIEILRVVVRESVTAVMVDRLVADLVSSLSIYAVRPSKRSPHIV